MDTLMSADKCEGIIDELTLEMQRAADRCF